MSGHLRCDAIYAFTSRVNHCCAPSMKKPSDSDMLKRDRWPKISNGIAVLTASLKKGDLITAAGSAEGAIVGRPNTVEECAGLHATLAQLMREIVPALALMPAFEPLSVALGRFLEQLPGLCGEALLQAEERVLAEITNAAERDADQLREGDEEREGDGE